MSTAFYQNTFCKFLFIRRPHSTSMSAGNLTSALGLENTAFRADLATEYLVLPTDVTESFKYLLLSHRSRPFSQCKRHFSEGV